MLGFRAYVFWIFVLLGEKDISEYVDVDVDAYICLCILYLYTNTYVHVYISKYIYIYIYIYTCVCSCTLAIDWGNEKCPQLSFFDITRFLNGHKDQESLLNVSKLYFSQKTQKQQMYIYIYIYIYLYAVMRVFLYFTFKCC